MIMRKHFRGLLVILPIVSEYPDVRTNCFIPYRPTIIIRGRHKMIEGVLSIVSFMLLAPFINLLLPATKDS